MQISDLQLQWRLLSFERIFKTRGQEATILIDILPDNPPPTPKKINFKGSTKQEFKCAKLQSDVLNNTADTVLLSKPAQNHILWPLLRNSKNLSS